MEPTKKQSLNVYRERNRRLYALVDKIKLWTSRTGILHGVRSLRTEGESLVISTHCGCTFTVRDSKNGRGIRQLRNQNYKQVCKKCGVPQWKIDKFLK